MILYVPKTYTKYLYTVIYWSLIKSWSLCHYYFPHQDTFYCISQATPINAWVRTLSAVLTESTERAVVERFMTYVSKYIFQTLLCVYICVYKYTHTYIHTVISHTHTHEYAWEYAWRSEADIRCIPLYLLNAHIYTHTEYSWRPEVVIRSLPLLYIYIKYTHKERSMHGSQRLISDVSHYYFFRQTRCLKTLWPSWPESPRDLLASASPILGLEAFMRMLGITLKFSCSQGKHLPTKYAPSPNTNFNL